MVEHLHVAKEWYSILMLHRQWYSILTLPTSSLFVTVGTSVSDSYTAVLAWQFAPIHAAVDPGYIREAKTDCWRFVPSSYHLNTCSSLRTRGNHRTRLQLHGKSSHYNTQYYMLGNDFLASFPGFTVRSYSDQSEMQPRFRCISDWSKYERTVKPGNLGTKLPISKLKQLY